MSQPRRCPQCDAEIPADSPAGLCPPCLLRGANDSQSQHREGESPAEPGPTRLTPRNSGFVPPTVEELAGRLPQLEILELLGKGGMGAVYKARQRQLDRLVAVKILPGEVSHDPAFAERFVREARALAKLNHPHIVGVYDFGQTPSPQTPLQAGEGVSNSSLASSGSGAVGEGLYYFVMEFVEGTNLRQLIQRGELKPDEVLAIIPQVCEALQYAHEQGVVHRDIKPENILIDRRGRVKIADFGLAKLLDHDPAEHALTATHQVMGTLRYMAPEQMEGARDVDHRADIYSLGVIFYELLTRELPIGRFAPPSKKVAIDVRLDEVVLRTLEKEPEQRYQQASEVKSEIETISRTSLPANAAHPDSAKRAESFPATAVPSLLNSEQDTRPSWESAPLSWWFAQSEGTRRILWIALNSLFVFCLLGFFSFSGQSSSDGNFRYEVGAIDPWFVFERRVGSGQRSESGILPAWSWLFGVGAYVSGRLLLKLRAKKPQFQSGSQSTSAGTPLTQMRFAVPAATDIGRQAVFHFSSLGYQLAEQQADVCVFQRGGPWAGLWETDIRKLATRLTVRTVPAADGQAWVSCDWSVRTMGAWITRRDIRQLQAEGIGFQTLLGIPVPSEPAAVESTQWPRFSRFAIVGAVWALFGLLTVIPVLYFIGLNRVWNGTALSTDVIHSEPPLVFSIFMGALLAIGAGAPIGTTIFGSIALGQIKRSEGRIVGLPLAFADAVFFPLLIVFAGIAVPCALTLHSLLPLEMIAAAFPGGALAAVVCSVIGLALWRKIGPESSATSAGSLMPAAAGGPHDSSTSGSDQSSVHRPAVRRPKLVPVLAVLNVAGAMLLMLMSAMEEPAPFVLPESRVWQWWAKVDGVLGFVMAAGLFAASIGLLLWKPWARRLMLLVCIYGLASLVFDAPYLARFAIPDLYAEIQQTVTEEGVDPEAREFVAMFTVVTLMGGVMVVGLTWLIGQLVYFTRPRVVAAFTAPDERPNRFVEWLLTGTGAAVGILSVFGTLALLLGLAALQDHDQPATDLSVASPPPHLEPVTSGVGAEFTVPAGHVATLEIVTRRDGATVPVPPHCGYVMAPRDKPVAAAFRWSRSDQDGVESRRRMWSLEILTAGGGRGYTESIALPDELNAAVGAMTLALGTLTPGEEVIHWGIHDVRELPANGLIGLRVTVVAHEFESGGSGNAHIDWKKAQPAVSTTRRKLTSG